MSASIKPRAASFWLGALALACAGGERPLASPPRAAGPAQVVTAPSDEPALRDRDWGVLRSKRHGLKLALPEARSWLEPGPSTEAGRSWELRHEPTGSTLTVKRWRASRLPRVEACRAELGETTPDLASADETNLVSARDTRVPAGFTTRITLLALPGSGRRLRGQAQAVSAGVGECIAVVARTECSSEVELAERLRLFDAALSHLRLMRIDDRVPERADPPH
jgi:hypothetical protein